MRRDNIYRVRKRANLDSRYVISNPCDPERLDSWFQEEIRTISHQVERDVVLSVQQNLDAFVKWPKQALLLWEGCDRSKAFHRYPDSIRGFAGAVRVPLDPKRNGPAVVSYMVAGGVRPHRLGSYNRWTVHHLYSGKFRHPGSEGRTLHASKEPRHFTQSAGLVAIHPIADQMCDEYPCFAWLLRAESYRRFGYDPDQIFSEQAHDPYGFVGAGCHVQYGEQVNG